MNRLSIKLRIFKSLLTQLARIVLGLTIIIGCNHSSKTAERTKGNKNTKIAKGFYIDDSANYRCISLMNVTNQKLARRIILYNEKLTKPIATNGELLIKTPIHSVICLSTTQIGFVDFLGETDKVIGLSGTNHIYNKAINKRIAAGSIKEVGFGSTLNLETILTLHPDLVLSYNMLDLQSNSLALLEQNGIPVININEYEENHPLGKAEWLKVIAALFEKDELANKLFQDVEKHYNDLKHKVEKEKPLPSVLFNIPYSGVWYIPGGDSYTATFMKDARASYPWADNKTSRSLEVNLEAIFEKCQNANYWINPGTAQDLKEISNQDKRFEMFSAFKNQEVYNYNNRCNEDGSSDFWESGVTRPDLILEDYIAIFHPNCLPNHQLYYYKRLR